MKQDKLRVIFVDSKGNSFASPYQSGKLYRSLDKGKTWQSVLNVLDFVSSLCECTDGSLYAAEYCSPHHNQNKCCARIWMSNDTGVNWKLIFDKSKTARHIHNINIASNDWIYASVGESRTRLFIFIIKIIKKIPKGLINLLKSMKLIKKIIPDFDLIFDSEFKIYPDAGLWRYNGITWQKIYENQIIPIIEYDGYIYVGEEYPSIWTLRTNRILRFKDNGNSVITPEVVYDTGVIGKPYFKWMYKSKDKLTVILSDSTILETIDGKHYMEYNK